MNVFKEVKYVVVQHQKGKTMDTSNFILLRNWPKIRLKLNGCLRAGNRPATAQHAPGPPHSWGFHITQ